jgi:hypothetical protein
MTGYMLNQGSALVIAEPTGAQPKVYTGGETVIGFCLAYSYRGFCTSHQPVLIPFVGILNKTGEEVMRFERFVRSEDNITQSELSDAQRTLNRISKEQNALVDRLSKLNTEQQIAALPEMRKELFALWQEALPLLFKEQFVYGYNTHKHGPVTHRPRKTGMQRCSFSLLTPVLSFVLKTYAGHYTLTPRVAVNGRELRLQHNPDFFMYDEEQKQYHILGSLQDNDVLAWMSKSENKLTIVTDHFNDSYESFISQLIRCYHVVSLYEQL